eukprot:373680-Hanusia_phi.AAC.10
MNQLSLFGLRHSNSKRWVWEGIEEEAETMGRGSEEGEGTRCVNGKGDQGRGGRCAKGGWEGEPLRLSDIAVE